MTAQGQGDASAHHDKAASAAAADRERIRAVWLARESPSFCAETYRSRRVTELARTIPGEPVDVRLRLGRKLDSYSVARSYGVAVPHIFGAWASPDEVPFDELPDEFVLKTNRGASSKGVLPVRKSGSDFDVVGTGRTLSVDELRAVFRDRPGGRSTGPVFAESLLHAGDGSPIPIDVKVYCFFGEVGHVLLRQMREHGNTKTAGWRYVSPDGSDLGRVAYSRNIDVSVPLPQAFDELCDVARTLSKAVSTPFVRVDLYEADEGIVFGEFTPNPGGSQRYRGAHDEYLGRLWEAADARLAAEIRSGRVEGIVYGPEPRELENVSRHWYV